MSEPDFLTVEDVLLLHGEQIGRYGGASGIRNEGALDAAVAVPVATFDGKWLHRDLFEMAAAYAFHIAQDQPFVDGNKRAGLAAALVFLELNGTSIQDSAGELYQAMIDIADRKLDKLGLAALLRRLATTSPG